MRSFGADAAHVPGTPSRRSTVCSRQGVAACAKHFPGHGDTVTDSHLALPRVDAPAERARGARARAVPCRGAGGHRLHHDLPRRRRPRSTPGGPRPSRTTVLGGVLRGRLGFDGVVVSDALDMARRQRGDRHPGGCGARARGRLRPAVHRFGHDGGAVPRGRRDSPGGSRVRAPGRGASGRRGAAGRPAAQGLRALDRAGAPLAPAPPICGRMAWWRRHSRSAGRLASGWPSRRHRPSSRWPRSPTSPSVRWHGGRGRRPDHARDRRARRRQGGGRRARAGTRSPALADGSDVRAQGHPTIVVESGWPRGDADVVTYGGSPVVAQALGRLLGVTAS